MAPINEGISHPHNRPSSKPFKIIHRICGTSKRSGFGKTNKPVDHPAPASATGNHATNSNSSPAPAVDGNSDGELDKSSADPIDEDDGGMSTLEMMLSPPEFDINPRSKHLDVKVYHAHYQPNRTMGPFIPQPPSPSKEKPGSPDYRRENIMERLKHTLNERSNTSSANASDGGNEGDVEDNDSPDGSDLEAPDMPKSTTSSHIDPPTTPRRVLCSQAIDHDSDSPTPSPRTIAPKPKRKRTNSTTDAATPTKGQRVSKRQRKSISNSPLPPMPPVKRTRAEQKKFQAKLDHLVFDPQRPGSVEREAVEIKSGAKEWRKASLHDELWDGNSKSSE